MRGRKPNPPIYVLPHGIEVIGEYAPNAKCPYWRVRIRPHRFFPNAPVVSNGIYVRRNRVMLAAKLGHALLPAEHRTKLIDLLDLVICGGESGPKARPMP